MKKNLIIFGTRPEAIKMAPVYQAFKDRSDLFETRICITAQHRQMLDQVLDFFEIRPDYDLDIMKPDQNLFSLTADILIGLKGVIDDFKPDYIYVHGDTTTSMVGALAGFYSNVKICHVEAGLRTYNKQSPFPEEINRQLTGRLADIHFAPTSKAKDNLIKEGVSENAILVTGNTVIDALLQSSKLVSDRDPSAEIAMLQSILQEGKKYILVTGHRRENQGQGFVNICNALDRISKLSDVQIIYPVHLNPNVKDPVYSRLGKNENISLILPLSYPAFIWLMMRSYIILTDSGGVQEEAPSLGKPVLVMRDTTERPEAVDAGTVILVGTDENLIYEKTKFLLTNEAEYQRMSALSNPYGDGKASDRIVKFIHKI